jgi:hypothetical protein
MKIQLTETQLKKVLNKFLKFKKIEFTKFYIRGMKNNLLKINILVDHEKLTENSPNFDREYREEIFDLDFGRYEKRLQTAIDFIGLDYFDLLYEHIHLGVYDDVIKTLSEVGLNPKITTDLEDPYVTISYDPYNNDRFESDEEVSNFLIEKGIYIDDIKLIHRW